MKAWLFFHFAVCSCLAACQLCLCPQLCQQLINTTLCLAFLRKLSTSLLCTPSNTNFFYQNLVLVAEYHVDC